MLNAFYDLTFNPPTFNFFDFLLQAEMHRLKIGEERMRVRIIPGPLEGFRSDRLPPYGGAERRRWRDNICIPMPLLLPSCGAEALIFDGAEKLEGPEFGKRKYLVGFHTNFQAASKGVYPFRANGEAYRSMHGDYVTITLRETGWWLSRQSDPLVWRAVAHELASIGFKVLVLRDAMKAYEPFHGFDTVPEASCNVYLRASLYAGARMNIGIANGPLWFAWFMGVPVILFDLIHDDEPCASAQSYTAAGLAVGSQLPNARPRQRLVWPKASVQSVLEAFTEVMEIEHGLIG